MRSSNLPRFGQFPDDGRDMKKRPQIKHIPFPWGLAILAALMVLLGMLFYEFGNSYFEH